MKKKNILFLSRWYPYPPNNGSKLRIYHLLRGLAQVHEITLISFSEQPELDRVEPHLRALCEAILIVPWKEYQPSSTRAVLGFFSPTPRSLLDTHSAEMARRIVEAISTNNYDIVIASELGAASYRRFFREMPAIFEDVEIGVVRGKSISANSLRERIRHGLTWQKHKRYITRLVKSYDTCTVVSKQDQALLTENIKGLNSVDVIPNCVNLSDYSAVPRERQKQSLIFTGPFRYHANYEAMLWFLGEAYPKVRSQIPEVQLLITGDHAGLPLQDASGVTLTGMVPDVRPLIASATVSIAPILTGGGSRLKILEAMALRSPVVATSKGAEGLDVQHGEHLLIADTPDLFAKAISDLIQRYELREQLCENAYRLVREKYNWEIVLPSFLQIVDQVASNSKLSI